MFSGDNFERGILSRGHNASEKVSYARLSSACCWVFVQKSGEMRSVGSAFLIMDQWIPGYEKVQQIEGPLLLVAGMIRFKDHDG